ncbi:MAG: ABC transporter permease subunit [Anaerolineae bacterium]
MATAALPARPESRSITRRVVVVAGVVLLIFFAFIEIVPFVLTVTNSFKCLPAVQANPQAFVPVPPFGVSCRTDSGAARSASEVSTPLTFNPALEGYNEIFGQNLGQWFVNTVVFSVAVTLARLLFDSLAGYALARIKFPGNRVFFFVMLGTMMIPGVVLLIPRFIILKQLGMLNTYQGFIFSLAADAFGVFLMKQFFESIPEEIEEAAQVDGASRFVMFFRVVLPMATPALTALTIFRQGVEQLHGRADHPGRQPESVQSAAGTGAAAWRVWRDPALAHVPRRVGDHDAAAGTGLFRVPALLCRRHQLFGAEGMIEGFRAGWRGLRSLEHQGYVYIWANLLWILLSLPIITAPAAWAGLIRLSYHTQRSPTAAQFSEFWQGFRENLKRGALLGLANVAVIGINVVNLLAYRDANGLAADTSRMVWTLALLLWLAASFMRGPVLRDGTAVAAGRVSQRRRDDRPQPAVHAGNPAADGGVDRAQRTVPGGVAAPDRRGARVDCQRRVQNRIRASGIGTTREAAPLSDEAFFQNF